MFEHRIGPEEIAWIQRDQFVYYLEMEHELGEPADWPTFRLGLVGALTAALGLDSRYPLGELRPELFTVDQRRALHLLDEIRQTHDPARAWPAFREAIWSRRDELRNDLAS